MLRNGKEEIYFKWMGSPPVLLSELSRQANAISRVLQDWTVPTAVDRNEVLRQVKPCWTYSC